MGTKDQEMTRVQTLQTPCLLLDEAKLRRNIDRLNTILGGLGVSLRPHLKTTKCIEIAQLAMASPSGPAAVSTLAEAEYFAQCGVTDILYAVGITSTKLDRIVALLRRGISTTVILDSVDQARAIVEKVRETDIPIPVLIEIDCDGHRSGIPPQSATLLEVARMLVDGRVPLRGIMTHAGESYSCRSPDAIVAMAEQERAAAVCAAERLRAAGFACPVVSVGSTPTAHFAQSLAGVTEVRAGVYMLFDLVMAGLGVCDVDDIAISVLATVIGHQRERGWILIDAGWMAMSRDRGTVKQAVDQGYGLVADIRGNPYGDLIIQDANQEHGVVSVRPGSAAKLPDLPVGSLVRLFPNHACATASQYGAYQVLDETGQAVRTIWERCSGW